MAESFFVSFSEEGRVKTEQIHAQLAGRTVVCDAGFSVAKRSVRK